MKVVLALLFLFIFTSCAHQGKSGFYVKFRAKDSVSKIAHHYKISKELLIRANPGKEFRPGDIIFIPINAGILGRHTVEELAIGRSPASLIPTTSTGFTWPVPATARISSYYGKRWRGFHDGIDIPAPRGTRIVSAADGLVVYAGSDLGGYGNIVVIGHPNGYFTIYAHTRRFFVHKGQRVMKGQVIAQVGSTGHSTGPHLHFEIRFDGRSYNPLQFVTRPGSRKRYAQR